MPLTALAVQTAKPKDRPYKIFDGGGLFLLVSPTGFKSWHLAYRIGGKQTKVALGEFPAVGLGEARNRRHAAKQQLDNGVDPAGAKKQARAAARKPKGTNTFESVARDWHARRQKGFTEKHIGRVIKYLEAYIFPEIGALDVREVKPLVLLATIRKVEEHGADELPRRLLGTCGQVFRYAIANGLAEHDPSHTITDALAQRRKVVHRTALQETELSEFFDRLNSYENIGVAIMALKFTVMTAVRTIETRGAVWSEFEGLDGATPLWRIPAVRMKMTRPHLVPLPRQSVEILTQARMRWPDSKWVFYSKESRNGSMSENAMLYLLYRLGYHKRATVHGFRGSFSTIANEHGFNADHIELQLAHSDGDGVRAAYNAAEWLPQRRELLQWWADFLIEKGLSV